MSVIFQEKKTIEEAIIELYLEIKLRNEDSV